ncbi:hypothetical protein [Herbaspirillum hiltneri]|uniref:hypothetical protein n=1 Tax=Herbaspirillum hiltneri TaxID=341045 RepID=UPI001396410A|nr:hypothetical protein [Herbaspirillum hiltneri]
MPTLDNTAHYLQWPEKRISLGFDQLHSLFILVDNGLKDAESRFQILSAIRHGQPFAPSFAGVSANALQFENGFVAFAPMPSSLTVRRISGSVEVTTKTLPGQTGPTLPLYQINPCSSSKLGLSA